MPKNSTSVPLVAVVTRTKNRPVFLERAIRSVRSQTMDDFVHVIINDGGDKKVVETVLDRCAGNKKGSLKVIHNEKSHGMEAALNLGILSVDSVFLAIHDDDDSWSPDFLQQTTTHLQQSSAMGVVVATDRVEEEILGDTITTVRTERWLPGLTGISLYKQCLDNYATPITFLYRREALETVGYYDETLPVCADWDFGIRFLQHFDIDFLNTEPALARYHHRPKAKGVNGNSVFAEKDLHVHYMNVLRNKYLRQDVLSGKMGVGYIMNALEADREREQAAESYLDKQVVRLEGHMNYCTRELQGHIDKTTKQIVESTLSARVLRRLRPKRNIK